MLRPITLGEIQFMGAMVTAPPSGVMPDTAMMGTARHVGETQPLAVTVTAQLNGVTLRMVTMALAQRAGETASTETTE